MHDTTHILVVDSDAAHVATVRAAFVGRPVEVEAVGSLAEARTRLASGGVDLVLADLALPDGTGTDLLADTQGERPLVIVTAEGDEESAVAAMKAGALDYLVKSPAIVEALPHITKGVLREWRQLVRLRVAEDQLRHADRLAIVGKLSASVAHEVGTPLSIVRLRAQLLQEEPADPAAVEESAGEIVAEVDRVVTLLRQVLDLARARTARVGFVDLVQASERALRLVAPMARKARVEVDLRAEGPVVAPIDPLQLQQVLLNLATNAIQAMPKGGRLTVECTDDRSPGEGESTSARLVVRDTGIGIAPGDLPLVFEPFFTTKEAGEGTGLGLGVCQSIVQDHGGWITVESTPGEGATFTVHLPLSEG